MSVDYSFLTKYFGDSVTDTGILLILVVIDTVLALSYAMGNGHKFTSAKMLSGILRNTLLSVVPLGIRAIALVEPRKDDLYMILSAIFFVFIGWSVLVSIVSYLSLLGIKFPDWLLKIVDGEIQAKGSPVGISSVKDSEKSDKDGSK